MNKTASCAFFVLHLSPALGGTGGLSASGQSISIARRHWRIKPASATRPTLYSSFLLRPFLGRTPCADITRLNRWLSRKTMSTEGFLPVPLTTVGQRLRTPQQNSADPEKTAAKTPGKTAQERSSAIGRVSLPFPPVRGTSGCPARFPRFRTGARGRNRTSKGGINRG